MLTLSEIIEDLARRESKLRDSMNSNIAHDCAEYAAVHAELAGLHFTAREALRRARDLASVELGEPPDAA